MKYGFRKELVTAAVVFTLAFVTAACSGPQDQETDSSTGGTTTTAAAAATPTPPPPEPVEPEEAADTAPSPAPEPEPEEEPEPEPAPTASSGRTTNDGIYTAAQAKRGQSEFQINCTTCHNITDFQGSYFQSRWGGGTVGDIHDFMTSNMPMDAPGSLSDEQYVDILAFFISQNGYPAGKTELPSSPETLAKIKFSQPASGD